MISSSEALELSFKGDPERALIIADTKIREAAKQSLQQTKLIFSKHLYGFPEMRILMRKLQSKGYFCMINLLDSNSNNHEIEVRW
ncbi:hypothetical protein [Acinetobacter baumannii]|uniref:hypothetical protein n=1 Tax=Acinetobacter baumannii TaxID=470 RepID=UPI003AF8B2D7